MTKRISFIMIAATLLIAGCAKESTTSIKATIADYGHGEKVILDNANFSCWEVSDQLQVNACGDPCSVTSVTNDGRTGMISIPSGITAPFFAAYPKSAVSSIAITQGANNSPATGSATITLPDVQVYQESNGVQKIEAPMAAFTQTGHSLNFYNVASLLKVTVPRNTDVTSIVVTTTGDYRPVLCGTGTITFSGSKPSMGELSNANGPDGGCTVTLLVNQNAKTHSLLDGVNEDYYIVVPPITTPTSFKVKVNYYKVNYYNGHYNGHYLENVLEQSSTASSTIPASTIATVDFSSKDFEPRLDNFDPDEFLPGIFSVSPTLKVNFSKANLVYNNGSWQYQSNQYTTFTNSSSASEYLHMSAANGRGALVDNNGYGNTTEFYDWGRHINENNAATPWFTLSAEQWDYLLNRRPVTYQRYAHATVGGATGLLLFPDTFTWPDASIDIDNNYTTKEWSKLERAGCVFLRGNGYQNIGNGHNPQITGNGEGYYWTSDYTGGAQTNSYIHFTNSAITIPSNSTEQAGIGRNVRIVHIAQ